MSRRIILTTAIIIVIISSLIILSHQNYSEKFLTINNRKIKLEIADTQAKQERGLSGRNSLAENSGMLFVFPDDIRPNFWMKDMNFNLDIIWLDKNWQIVGVEKNLSPTTFPKTFSPETPVRYVLEVSGNFVDKHEIKVGDKAYN